MWNESRRDESGAALGELCVVDAAASHHFIFYAPRQAALRVFLHVARHVRVAPPAHGYVERGARSPHIRHRRTKADALNQLLGFDSILHAQLFLAPPHPVAVGFNLFRQRLDHDAVSDACGAHSGGKSPRVSVASNIFYEPALPGQETARPSIRLTAQRLAY